MTAVSRPWPATRPITEAELQNCVVSLADVLGWRTYHTYDSRRSAKGFPDLFMVRAERAIAAELKSATGRSTAEQDAWLCALEGAGIETHLWRPAAWLSGEIEAVLR